MNSLKIVLSRFAGIVFGLGLLVSPMALAYASSVSIQSLSPGTTVTPGNEVSFTATSAGFESAVTYSVSDSFGGSSVSNTDFNNVGVFAWIPTTNDAGTHTLTITATDQNGGTASVSQQIIVQGPPTAQVQSLSPGSSVTVGQAVSFSVAANNFVNPTYAVADSFSNSSITSGSMNASGNFNWTPLSQDVGTHTLTVTVNDSSGHTATATQTITVLPSASVSIQSLTPGASVSFGQTLTFIATPNGFTNPYYSLSDSFTGSTVSTNNINSSGSFSWTPLSTEVGTHTITVSAADSSGKHANATVSIIVGAPAAATTTVTTTAVSQPAPASTSALSQSQVQSILSLLQSFGADQSTINGVSVALGGGQAAGSGTTVSASSAESGDTFTKYLSLGVTDTEVSDLQNVLIAQGLFSGSATGYYGPLTEKAVRAFQRAHNLTQLGVVGPGTRAALNALSGSGSSSTPASSSTAAASNDGFKFNTPLSLGSTGNDVTELQKRLTREGVYTGPVNGSFGPQTEAAVMAYQAKHGLTQLGSVGPGTRAALNQ